MLHNANFTILLYELTELHNRWKDEGQGPFLIIHILFVSLKDVNNPVFVFYCLPSKTPQGVTSLVLFINSRVFDSGKCADVDTLAAPNP